MGLFRKKENVWTAPAGQISVLFRDALEQPHILVAGSTGAGKSVLLNGLIYTALYRRPDNEPSTSYGGRSAFILIDPKRVELAQFKKLPHTLFHAAGYDPDAWKLALRMALNKMDARYATMEMEGLKEWTGGDLFVIIDEWATVYKGGGKECFNAVLRLASEGRAAKVHLIMATQVPKASIIPTEIRENMIAKFALMCNTATESRVIMGVKGCEDLPDPKTKGKAYGYFCLPGKNNRTLYELPYVHQSEIDRLINHWLAQ